MAKIKDLDDLESKEENKFIAAADMSKKGNGKGGRPKKEAKDKATEQIFVNVTQDEKSKIEDYAKDLGISISALCKISLFKFGALE